MWCGKADRPNMTVDEVILKALEGGPATVNDINKRLERLVRIKLERLRVRGVVVREGTRRRAPAVHLQTIKPRPRREGVQREGRRSLASCKSDTRTALAGRYASSVIPRGGRVLGAGEASCSESKTAGRACHLSCAKARQIERKEAGKGTSRRAIAAGQYPNEPQR